MRRAAEMGLAMSATISPGGGRTKKTTCAKCKRTVVIAATADGEIATDPELITVIEFSGSHRKLLARRAHGELCTRYQIEGERAKLKIAAARFAGKVRK